MSVSLGIATTPLAMMVEDRIAHYRLPYAFEGEWDVLATNPVMVVRLPLTCELIAYFLTSLRQSQDGLEDLRELRMINLQAGPFWDVVYNKWAITVHVPDEPAAIFDTADLQALLKARI